MAVAGLKVHLWMAENPSLAMVRIFAPLEVAGTPDLPSIPLYYCK